MRTILLTDDNRNIREYCRDVLEDDGYRVVLAADGLEALRVFREVSPDLVILETWLPRMTGLEALARLKAIAPEVPVILFTAHDEDCVRDPRGNLATACVEKSADLSELTRTIERVFRPASPRERGWPLRLGLPPEPGGGAALESLPCWGGKL